MNRAAICVLILIAMLSGAVLSLCMISRSTDRVLGQIDEIILKSEEGSPEEIEESIETLEHYWLEHYDRLSYFVQRGPLNDISYALAKLMPLYRSKADDFIAECRGIRYWVELIFESQLPL